MKEKTYEFWIDFTPICISIKAKDTDEAEAKAQKEASDYMKDNQLDLDYELNFDGEVEE